MTASWPWPPEMEGIVAAPQSHRVLLETPAVRVLEVVIQPGSREPEHTHRHPSVMIVDQPAQIRYYDRGDLVFESTSEAHTTGPPRVEWMDPEGPHAVENIGRRRYHAFRIELLQAADTGPDAHESSSALDLSERGSSACQR